MSQVAVTAPPKVFALFGSLALTCTTRLPIADPGCNLKRSATTAFQRFRSAIFNNSRTKNTKNERPQRSSRRWRIFWGNASQFRRCADAPLTPRRDLTCSRRCRFRNRRGVLLDQSGHRLRGLRAILDPVLDTVVLQLDGHWLRDRIVEPDHLYRPAVARSFFINHDHPVRRFFLGAKARQSNQ